VKLQKELLNKFQPINKYQDKIPYHRSQINKSRENNHKRTPKKYRNKITKVLLIDDSIIEKISMQEHQRDIKIIIGIPIDDSIVEKTASKEHPERYRNNNNYRDTNRRLYIRGNNHERTPEKYINRFENSQTPEFKEIVIKKQQKELCVIDAMKKNTMLIMVYIVKNTSRI